MTFDHRPRSATTRERVLGLLSLLPIPGATSADTDAHAYWTEEDGGQWRSNSHWRDGDAYHEDLWLRLGQDHLAMYRSMTGRDLDGWGTVVDWGCGGGANAMAFAPLAERYVAVDLTERTLAECRRQVATVSDTEMTTIVADPAHPEAAVTGLDGGCDLFLCTYVLELVPSPAHGLRLMALAERLLAPGGTAFVQIKYQTHERWTRPRRSFYRKNVVNMTTYRVEDFWVRMLEVGLEPRSVRLVPRNELDNRYAYFLLEKAQGVLEASA